MNAKRFRGSGKSKDLSRGEGKNQLENKFIENLRRKTQW
jgi:hypothetical protein